MVSVTRSGDSPQLNDTLAYNVTGSDEIHEERDRLAAATEDMEAVMEVDVSRMPGLTNVRSFHW